MFRFAEESRTKGLKVIIAGAGGAGPLPGMVAAKTNLSLVFQLKHTNIKRY